MGRASTVTCRCLPLLLASLVGLAGCGNDTSMTKADEELMKHPPKMTDANRATMASAMAEGSRKAASAETAWAAKQDPAKIAKINADRAAMGRPPLGTGP